MNSDVITCSAFNPSGTVSSFQRLRNSIPAPVSRITETAIWAATSDFPQKGAPAAGGSSADQRFGAGILESRRETEDKTGEQRSREREDQRAHVQRGLLQ